MRHRGLERKTEQKTFSELESVKVAAELLCFCQITASFDELWPTEFCWKNYKLFVLFKTPFYKSNIGTHCTPRTDS